MDIDKVIDAVEKYLREFILYLMAFFWNGKHGDQPDPFVETLNKSVIFSILSAVVGAYLSTRLVPQAAPRPDKLDMLGEVVDNLLRWASLGLLLYAITRLLREHVHIVLPVIAVMRLFAVSNVIAVYCTYVAMGLIDEFANKPNILPAKHFASIAVYYCVELFIVCLFAPREIFGLLPLHRLRRRLACAAFFVVVIVVVMTPLVDRIDDGGDPYSIAVESSYAMLWVGGLAALFTICAVWWQERAATRKPSGNSDSVGGTIA